jgi:hypothetical protein
MFKNQHEVTCFFLLQSSLNKKSKIGTIPLTFLNGKQQKDNHTHQFFALFLQQKRKIGTILPTFPNGKEPKIDKIKKIICTHTKL